MAASIRVRNADRNLNRRLRAIHMTSDLWTSPVSKRYLVWPIWLQGQGNYLMLRDVLLYKSTLLGNGTAGGIDGADVGDYGDVVFLQGPAPYNVFRYRGGSTTQLTHSTTYSHQGPLTDGINVVYSKQVSDTRWQIVLYSDTAGE